MLAGGRGEKHRQLVVSLVGPIEVGQSPAGHAGQLGHLRWHRRGRFGGAQLSHPVDNSLIGGLGPIGEAEAFVTKGHLVFHRQAPGELGGQGGQALIDREGIHGVALLEEIVGELVAGAALPVGPAFRVHV